MSDEHQHHPAAPAPAPAPETPDDAGSQALSEALRSSFAIVKFVMVALVVVFLASGIFQVGPQEKAVVLRFGKLVDAGPKALLGPGLHWSFPYPIDQVVKIPFKEIQSVESTVGWFQMSPADKAYYEANGSYPPNVGMNLNPAVDGYVITADRNIVHTRATIYYQVNDPIGAVFRFSAGTNAALNLSGVSNLVQNALNNALLHTAAQFGVDQILFSDKAGFQEAVRRRVVQLVDEENLGVTIQPQCSVDSIPPRQLNDIFAQVARANQNRAQLLDQARSDEIQITNSAGAQAAAIVYQAISANSNYVATVRADAAAFSKLLPNYRVNPDLFKQMDLVRTMGQALTNANFKSFLPTTAAGEPLELRLMLNRDLPGPKTGAAGQ